MRCGSIRDGDATCIEGSKSQFNAAVLATRGLTLQGPAMVFAGNVTHGRLKGVILGEVMAANIQTFSYLFLILCLFAQLGFWFPLCRLYGRVPSNMARQMWKLQSRSWRGVFQTWSLYLALFYVLKGTVWPSLDRMLPSIPICIVLGGVISFIGYSCLPPTVLFLASSKPAQRNLAVELVRSFRPYRVVYLLSDDISVGVYDHEDFSHNNLRMPDDVDWRSVVHPLMDMAAAIVIDTRIPSPAVVEEIQRVVQNNGFSKCVFVAMDSGDSPALDEAVSEQSARAELNTVPASQLVPYVKILVREWILDGSWKQTPTDQRKQENRKIRLLTPLEYRFLDVFLHEATTAPFTGPATETLRKNGLEYRDIEYIAWAYEQGAPRAGFAVGRAADVVPPLPWSNRQSALRRNQEIQRIWEQQQQGGGESER